MKSYLMHQCKFLLPLAGAVLACSALLAQDSGSVTNPLVVVVAPDPVALAGTSSGAFTLIRYGPTTSDLAVNVQLLGTGSNGLDYVQIPNVITIPAGSLATDVKVDPLVNKANPGNKNVILAVETNSNLSHSRAPYGRG